MINTVNNVYMYEHAVMHVGRQSIYTSFITFYLYLEYVG